MADFDVIAVGVLLCMTHMFVIELVLHFKVLAGNMNEPDCSEVSVLSENNPEQEDKSGDMNTNILDISNDRCQQQTHHASNSSIYFDCQEY